MKKFCILLLLFIAYTTFSQTVGVPDAEKIGADVVNSEVKSITVEMFEDPGLWKSRIPMDLGMMQLKRREGFPDKRSEEDEEIVAEVEDCIARRCERRVIKPPSR